MKKALSDPAMIRELSVQDGLIRESLGLGASTISKAEFENSFVVDECIADSDIIAVGDETTVRVNIQLGHSSTSLSYFIQPHEYLICDEALGYYRGRDLPAPAPDRDQAQYRKTLTQLTKLELRALCLPFGGVLTGELLPKHLRSLAQPLRTLNSSVARVSPLALRPKSFALLSKPKYSPLPSRDPVLLSAMARSKEALFRQLLSSQVSK